MQVRFTATVAAILLAATLAGCAETPTGSFATSSEGITSNLAGAITVTYVPFQSSVDDTLQGVPGMIEDGSGGAIPARCALDPVLENPPVNAVLPPCVDAMTQVMANFSMLPISGTTGYTLWWISGSEDYDDVEVSSLEAHGMEEGSHDMFHDVDVSYNEDLTGAYSRFEIRRGDFVLATADGDGGALEVASTAVANLITGEWSGKSVTLHIRDLNQYHEGVAWFVDVADDGTKTHVESFPIINGTGNFDLEGTVGDYEEFHVHVGDSKINTAIATID